MNCPECNNGDTDMLHVDPLECADCGSTMNIEYWVCDKCNYSFRVINDEFLDGNRITVESMDEAIEDLLEFLDEEGNPFEDDSNVGSMLDLIHPCVKCGEAMTAYNSKTSEYECLVCGFKWEILKHE